MNTNINIKVTHHDNLQVVPGRRGEKDKDIVVFDNKTGRFMLLADIEKKNKGIN